MKIVSLPSTIVITFLSLCLLDGALAQPQQTKLSSPKIKASQAPSLYIKVWKQAENRRHCAPLVLFDVDTSQAKMRRANFSGGWAVAYDEKKLRSAYGVAGTGIDADPMEPKVFPYEKRWADGSLAYYGLEGGNGPNYLAYLKVAGQKCLYNVWSAKGKENLEFLLDHLRVVNTSK